MPIQICPNPDCRAKLNIPEQRDGKKVKCFKCNRTFVVKPPPPALPLPIGFTNITDPRPLLGDAEPDQAQDHPLPFTTPEVVGAERGLRKGIKLALKLRFGFEGLNLMPEIELINGEEQLEAILLALETVPSLEELRRLYSQEPKVSFDVARF